MSVEAVAGVTGTAADAAPVASSATNTEGIE